ncbi:hypothetical protein Taro_042721 [Colocasia esculenta]|uniref:Retrotransposon gag domain-containing protein n=1 Tax=Colocasia esculenta TaxID=4460 RepID=A0A843WEM8_COLES|nr:hypothetical protein [Colocasia esculenta]
MQPAAAVPPLPEEAVPVAPVPPPSKVEVPSVVPIHPAVLARSAIGEETTVLVERFLRLQPPTYSGGPNPDTAEHWIHEIERIQQMKREKFRTLQQGNLSVLEYQMRFMALSRTVEEAAQRAAILERTVRARQGQSQTTGLGSGSFRHPQPSGGISKGKSTFWSFFVIWNSKGELADVDLLKATDWCVALRGLCSRISGRFNLLGLGLACSLHEEVVWSGGNVAWTLYFACFAKLNPLAVWFKGCALTIRTDLTLLFREWPAL